MVRETIQKKSESARVAQRTIMSVIILEYSFISTSLSESILASCRQSIQEGIIAGYNRVTRTILPWKPFLKSRTVVLDVNQ